MSARQNASAIRRLCAYHHPAKFEQTIEDISLSLSQSSIGTTSAALSQADESWFSKSVSKSKSDQSTRPSIPIPISISTLLARTART
jgi:hypothetical protein